MLPNEMKSAEELMEKSPDSALHLLQQIKTNQTFSNADQALYGLLLFEALDKNDLPLRPDSVINYSLDYYQSKNDKPRLAKCYFYKGRMYNNAQHYDEATDLYLKALDNCNYKKDFELLGKIYSDMGSICFLQKDYNQARVKYFESKKYFEKSFKKIDVSYSLLNIGQTYRAKKDFKTAKKFYSKAINYSNDSILTGSALQEIGINFYSAKQNDSAEFYLRKSLVFPNSNYNLSIRYYTLADLYYNTRRYDSIYKIAHLALEYPINAYTKKECYRLLANTAFIKGDFEKMANYMTKFQSCTDSIQKIESQTKTTILENIHETTKNVGKTRNYISILSWIIPMIVLISLLIFLRLKSRNKNKEKQLIQVELKLSEKQATLKNSLKQKIEEIKAHQLPEYRKSNLAKREQMDKEAYNISLHLNDWKQFSEIMNRTFNNIVSFLESTYPDLTHKDIIWCCLYLLNTHSTDMAIVLECKPESLYKLKQRLAKKMNFKTTIELNQFLHEKSIGK